MKKIIFISLLIFTINTSSFSQAKILTVAESSDYTSTSTYKEVMNFIEEIKKSTTNLKIEYIATSTFGKKIPLLIIADPLPENPEDLKDDDRVVVYIQANIHAGEVEGKEGSLMLLRDLLQTDYSDILKDVVVLIVPILNADGNDQISTQNRSRQNGPKAVGVRHNGQSLDLNRDALKLETPEMNGVVQHIFNRWDPAVTVDCHTTNGSYHEEPVTFSWMINPNGDRALINYMRDEMMPVVQERLQNHYKIDNCFYGNFIDNRDPEKGWRFGAAAPRYMTNYIGLRNRLAILNENYVYADYKSRVIGSYYLLHSILDYSAAHKDEIKKQVNDADNRTKIKGMDPQENHKFALKYKAVPTPEKVTIKAFEVESYVDANGRNRYRPTEIKKLVTVPYFADYIATEESQFPFAYIITNFDPDIIANMKAHGIVIEKLTNDTDIQVEKFSFNEITAGRSINQGHFNTTYKGEFVTETVTFKKGTMIVRTGQPLGNLITYLFEPNTDDGYLYWNFFNKYLAPQWGRSYYAYPAYKVLKKVNISSSIID